MAINVSMSDLTAVPRMSATIASLFLILRSSR
jgi:hypothetical protein